MLDKCLTPLQIITMHFFGKIPHEASLNGKYHKIVGKGSYVPFAAFIYAFRGLLYLAGLHFLEY